MYEAKIILDSINEYGNRLTTFELTYPRMIHSEFMTHRLFSRNSSSSRAIPIKKLRQKIIDDPVKPVWWGKNQSGMQAKSEVGVLDKAKSEMIWLMARDLAVEYSIALEAIGLHKQIVNRLLEPWMWITVICTATEYDNFFQLRCHEDAQPEIQEIARMMRIIYDSHIPELLEIGRWHLPYISEEDSKEYSIEEQKKLSVARCARVSYLTHDGEHNPEKDLALYKYLWESGHYSPFEHQARSSYDNMKSGNFSGWVQHRKEVEHDSFR